MDPIDRYHTDAVYRALVVTMKALIKEGGLTGNDVVEAAELARRMSELSAPIITIWR